MAKEKYYSWSAINKFGCQFIGFVGNVFIARLLTPDDYGLVAMLSIFIGIAWNFTESGFADGLIKKANADELDFSTIFVYNLSIGCILYAFLYVVAPFVADFFHRIELEGILRVIGLSVVFRALTIVEVTRLRKELQFKTIAIVFVISTFLSTFIGYLLALSGYGYWSIVYQNLSVPVINLVYMIFFLKWRPTFRFDWTRYKEMSRFGYNLMASYFTNQIGANIYTLFIGKSHSSKDLGFYAQGIKISDAAFQGINSVILTTSYSIIARESSPSKRREMYLSIFNHFSFIHFAVSFFLIGSAWPLINVFFGEQWVPSALFMQLILIGFLLNPFVTINSNMIKIAGKSKLYRNLTFIRNGLNVAALLLTFRYSIETILVGQILARYTSAFLDVVSCGRYGGIRWSEQFMICINQIVVPGLACLFSWNMIRGLPIDVTSLVYFSIVFFVIFFVGNMITGNHVQRIYVEKYLKFK